jgi:hypothetical protein
MTTSFIITAPGLLHAIYAEQWHATVHLLIGLFPNRLECAFGELCAELSNRIPEELEFEPGQNRVGDCFSGQQTIRQEAVDAVDLARCPSFAADQDEGPQRGSGQSIPSLVSEIQAATTNAGTRAQDGLTPDFLTLSTPPNEPAAQPVITAGDMLAPNEAEIVMNSIT